MPKQIYELRSFDRGIMSSPEDELDLPDNAATYSLNIDPLSDGELKGVPKSVYLKESGFINDYILNSYNRPSSNSPFAAATSPPASNTMNNNVTP
tara:strand:+ start:50 stop:334 length:285 start_codon:yes stop_codon:yes gene_type:complete